MRQVATMKPEPAPPSHSDLGSSFPGLSINQLARMHCRERLLVSPLYWTNRQLELLQCSFSEPCPASPINSFMFTDERNGALFVRGLLKRHDQMVERESDIRAILASSDCLFINASVPTTTNYCLPFSDWDYSSRNGLHFYFAGRGRKVLPCVALFPRDRPEEACIAAYVDQQRLEYMRSEALVPSAYLRKGRKIAFALYRLRLRIITPENPFHDPYIVALLLAVAQDRYKALLETLEQPRADSCPDTFPVCRPFLYHDLFR